jgi:hypothetical protein
MIAMTTTLMIAVAALADYFPGRRALSPMEALTTAKFDVEVVEPQANISSLSPAEIQEHRKVLVRTVLAGGIPAQVSYGQYPRRRLFAD